MSNGVSPRNLVIQHRITAVEPIVINKPISQIVEHSDPRVKDGQKTVPFLPVNGHNGTIEYRPVIPATKLRGTMRRCAMDEIWNAVSEHPAYGETYGDSKRWFSMEDYYLLALGGTEIASTKDQERMSMAATNKVRKAAPILGLFGCINWKMRGSCFMDMPQCPAGPDAVGLTPPSVRGDDFQTDPTLIDTLSEGEIEQIGQENEATREISRKRKSLSKLRSQRSQAVKNNNDTSELDANIQKLEVEIQEAENNKTVSRNAVKRVNRPPYAVVPGAEFFGEISLMGALPAEIGLFFEALRRFAATPFVGAKESQGFGRIAFDADIYESSSDTGVLTYVGHVGFGGGRMIASDAPRGFTLTPKDDQVTPISEGLETWHQVRREAIGGYYDGVPLSWHKSDLETMAVA